MPGHPCHLEVPRDTGPGEYPSGGGEEDGKHTKETALWTVPTTAGQYYERKCFLQKGTERKDEVLRSTSCLPLFSPNYYPSTQFSVSDLG